MSELWQGVMIGASAILAGIPILIAALAHYGLLLPTLRLLYRCLSYGFAFARRGRDAVYIEEHIERVSRRLERECPGCAPYAPRIQWVRAPDLGSIRNAEVVVCLSPGTEKPINLVRAALQYLHTGLVAEARPYMHAALSRGLDLAIARDMVAYDAEAQRALMTEVAAPEIQADPEKGKWFGIFDQLKRDGLLSRLYLEEIGRRGRRLYPVVAPSGPLFKETAEFTEFVSRIAGRQLGELVPLSFNGATLRCAVVLVASTWKLDTFGDAHHWWRLLKELRQGAETVFLIGLTPQGVNAARMIADRALRLGLTSSRVEKPFHAVGQVGGRAWGPVVIQCAASAGLATVGTTPEEEVEEVLRVLIPELAEDRVEIVGVARAAGRLTKVALRDRFGESDRTALVGVCSDPAAQKAQQELGETVHLVAWSSDAMQYIGAALGIGTEGLRLNGRIDLEEARNYCLITVQTKGDLDTLRGPEGINVRLAESLTGWTIGTMTA